jgi:hypothetical protein
MLFDPQSTRRIGIATTGQDCSTDSDGHQFARWLPCSRRVSYMQTKSIAPCSSKCSNIGLLLDQLLPLLER